MSGKSVLEIFKTMELKSVENNAAVTFAKDYLENYEKNGLKYGKHKHYVGSKSALHSLNKEARALLFSEAVVAIQKNEDNLVALLNLTVYNYEDSLSVIKKFCSDSYYYFSDIFVVNDSSLTGNLVNIHITSFEIPILGRLLSPALMLGYSVCLIIHDVDHLPFFVYLGDIFKGSGFPESTYSLVGTDFPVAEQLLCIKDCSPQPFCPVLVFSDADLDSAIDSSLQGAWRYKGKTLFTVTHIYIQEPVYDNFIERLVEKATQLKDSGLFEGCLKEDQSSPVDIEHCGSIKVFQPSINHAHRIFMGWDPRELLEDKFYDLGVSVLPFRTKDEGIALINKSRFGCCASVWSESINTVNYVSTRLEVNTVWINSHGILDSAVPLESQKESKVPLNGITLLNYLKDFGRPVRKLSCEESETGSNKLPKKIFDLDIKPLYLRGNIHTAVENAQKAYKLLLQFDKEKLLHFLNDLDPLSSCFEEEFGAYNMVDQLKGVYRKSQFENYSKLLIVRNMNIEWFSEPLGPIWIVLCNLYESVFADLVKLIYVSVTFSNSIIVTAYTEELQRLAYCAFQLFQGIGLPNGSLNYVQAKLSEIISDSTNLNCNSNARYINKFVFLDKEGSDKFPGFLGQFINVKMDNTPDLPYDLYSFMPRVVMIPIM